LQVRYRQDVRQAGPIRNVAHAEKLPKLTSAGHAISRKLSSAGEFHSHALPEPDVNLSIHPAPIVQPLTPTPNAQTGQAVGRVSATTTAMLAACARVVFCISVGPIAPGNHPACAMRRGDNTHRRHRRHQGRKLRLGLARRSGLGSDYQRHSGSGRYRRQGEANTGPVTSETAAIVKIADCEFRL
jgi:hypothetical protein